MKQLLIYASRDLSKKAMALTALFFFFSTLLLPVSPVKGEAASDLLGNLTCEQVKSLAQDAPAQLFKMWAESGKFGSNSALAEELVDRGNISGVLENIGDLLTIIQGLEEAVNGDPKKVAEIFSDWLLGKVLTATGSGVPGAVWTVCTSLNDFSVALNEEMLDANIRMFAQFAEKDSNLLGPNSTDYFLKNFLQIDESAYFMSNLQKKRTTFYEYARVYLGHTDFPPIDEWEDPKNWNMIRSAARSLLINVEKEVEKKKKFKQLQSELKSQLKQLKREQSVFNTFESLRAQVNAMVCQDPPATLNTRKGPGDSPKTPAGTMNGPNSTTKGAKDFAKKAGIYPEDFEQFLNCMCSACGGTLGGIYNPDFECDRGYGPCQCMGPLSIWKTPIPVADKERQYECFNQITSKHYYEAQAVFDKWRQEMLDANARSVEKEVKEIEELIAQQDFMRAADIFNAIEALIKDHMVTKYYNGKAYGDNLYNTLSTTIQNGLLKQAQADAADIEMENALATAVAKIAKACSITPSRSNGYCEGMQAKYIAWEKNWNDVISKEIPAAENFLKQGKYGSAEYALGAICARMGDQLPNRYHDPVLVALRDQIKEKRNEYIAAMEENKRVLAKLRSEPDPRGIVRTIDAVLKAWEHGKMTFDDLNRQSAEAAQNVRAAESSEKAGDDYQEKGSLARAIEQYQVSLKFQKDASVQRKLNALLSRLAKEKEDAQTRSAGCRSDNDCPPGYVCDSETGECGSPFDSNYSSFGQLLITIDDQRNESQAKQVAVNQQSTQNRGFSSDDFGEDLERVQGNLSLPPAQVSIDSPGTDPVNDSGNKPRGSSSGLRISDNTSGTGTNTTISIGPASEPPASLPPAQVLIDTPVPQAPPAGQPKPISTTQPKPPPADPVFDPMAFIGTWTYSGSRPDGKKRSGTMSFLFKGGPPYGGTLEYTIVDEDGQSNGQGNGTWSAKTGPSNSVNLTLYLGGKTWAGPASGKLNAFVFNSSHGTYNFRK